MAKAMMSGGMCKCPHHKAFGWVILILGVLFLLRDFSVWNFWNISWWTAAFLVVGLGGFCKCCDRGVC